MGCGSSPYGQISELQVQCDVDLWPPHAHAPCVQLYTQTCTHGPGDVAPRLRGALVALTEDLVMPLAPTWWLTTAGKTLVHM